jgi:hypothetical protein
MVAGEKPGDAEVAEPYSLEQVSGWLQDCPEQIERAVILGGQGQLLLGGGSTTNGRTTVSGDVA